MDILHPPGWARPKGYSNGIAATGRMVFISGMVGWDAQERFQAADLGGQVRQVLTNIVAVLGEEGFDSGKDGRSLRASGQNENGCGKKGPQH